MNRTRALVALLGYSLIIGAGSVPTTCAAEGGGIPELGTRRELFVDRFLVESMQNCDLLLHHPTPREVAIVHDAPWEGNLSCYHTVFKDGDTYRMYYRGTDLDCARGCAKKHEDVTCYAESDDGIHWRKPELGLFEFNGSTKNNILVGGYPAHNFAPFLDANPDCAPEQKYKAVGGHQQDPGLFGYVSADGIRWEPVSADPILTDGRFDSQNLAFWDPVRKEYRAYFRDFRRVDGVRVRDIKTAVSKDFLHWSTPEWCRYPDAPDEQLYTNQNTPYFRAPHIIVGFPMRYVDHGDPWSAWRDMHNHWPNFEQRKQRFAAGGNRTHRFATAVSDGLFMSTRDGRTFRRWQEAFLRPRPGSWSYGDSMFAWQLVQTRPAFPGAPDELSLYALEGTWTDASTRLRRYTLRLDGFVSVHAGAEEAEMVTRPFTFGGKALQINFATSAAGALRVGIQDENGVPISGFAVRDCPVMVGDSVDRTVSWDGGTDLTRLAGKPVRLRFTLRDADLYALRFVPEVPDVPFTPRSPSHDQVKAYLDAVAERESAHQAAVDAAKAALVKVGRESDWKAINAMVKENPEYEAAKQKEAHVQRELREQSLVVPGYARVANHMVKEQIVSLRTADWNSESRPSPAQALTADLLESFRGLIEDQPFTRAEYRDAVGRVMTSIASNTALIPRFAAPPVIDGKAEPKEWTGALTFTELELAQYLVHPERSHQLANKPRGSWTAVSIGYDDENLYLAFVCKETGRYARDRGLTIALEPKRSRDGEVWRDDAVGIVLEPDPSGSETFRLICNAGGTCYDARGGDAAWNGKPSVATTIDEEARQWTAEFAVPWSDLGVAPTSGRIMGGNACRYLNHLPGDGHWWWNLKCCAWTALPFGIDEPPPHGLPFGILILE